MVNMYFDKDGNVIKGVLIKGYFVVGVLGIVLGMEYVCQKYGIM